MIDVCVVMERKRNTNERSLYGVFHTEREARQDYGNEDDTYEPEFVMCRVRP